MTENEAIEKCDKLINGYSVNYSVSDAFSENGEPYPTFRVMAEFAETCKEALEEIQQYRAIGTIEELQALKEKNEPKMMDGYYCPICRHYFEDGELHLFCPCCGQALDWSE